MVSYLVSYAIQEVPLGKGGGFIRQSPKSSIFKCFGSRIIYLKGPITDNMSLDFLRAELEEIVHTIDPPTEDRTYECVIMSCGECK